ncbi:MAG: SRPBCC domain-containing protein [Candidatus Nitrosocosmicus sp.]|nr:SRPBCC domain-containing protein [Candidatus Nitrosocosmicus sp.]
MDKIEGEVNSTDMDKTVHVSTRDLVLSRIIDAPPDKVFRAWTEPELIKQWFTPRPFTTPIVETDQRPGGKNLIVMRGPDGKEFPNRGIYLEVIKNKRLVTRQTDGPFESWESIQEFESNGDKATLVSRVTNYQLPTTGKIVNFLTERQAKTS